MALGRLGWPLWRIEEATGVRRETVGDYLRRAGIVVRLPGSWGEKSLARAATLATTGSSEEAAKAANEVTTGSAAAELLCVLTVDQSRFRPAQIQI